MTPKREILATAFKLRALAAGLEAAINTPSKGHERAVDADDARAAWRAAHRSGYPPKLDADPELRAFVLERIDRLTFGEIAAEVAAQFPLERRVSRSTLHRWWRANEGAAIS